MVDNVDSTAQPGERRPVRALSVPDIPQTGEISQETLRAFMTAVRDNLTQLHGDGPNAALTLQRAVDVGLLQPKPPSSGGGGQLSIDPYTGYGNVTFSGIQVPPPATQRDGAPADIASLQAYASGSGGVYLVWTAPGRTGGEFFIYRGVRNRRSEATFMDRTFSLAYFDSTAAVRAVGDGTAAGPTYYYWVINRVMRGDDVYSEGEWSGGEEGGIPWSVNPETHTMIVADNILAGRLNVTMDLNVNGVLRSGKVNGGDTAPGFFIDGNTFYFGSANDGSYIRWTGNDLIISGDLYSARIYGGIIEGATLAGSYIFFKDLVYENALDAPMGGLYQSDYAAELGTDIGEPGRYHISVLVRKELLETNDYSSPPAVVGHGGVYTIYTEAVSGATQGDTIYPYDFSREGHYNREAHEATTKLVVDLTFISAGGWYTEPSDPFGWLAQSSYCAELILTRHFIEYGPNGAVTGSEDRVTIYNVSQGSGSFTLAANDPDGAVPHTIVANGGFFFPFYHGIGGNTVLPSGYTRECIQLQGQNSGGNAGKRHVYGDVINRLIIPITDNDKHMESWKLGFRFHTTVSLGNMFTPRAPNVSIRAWFRVDNTV